MKKRLKGLLAIMVVMCLTIALGMTTLANNCKYMYGIKTGSVWIDHGYTELNNSTILYEGDYIRQSEGSGGNLVIINSNGDSLLTDGDDLYVSNDETNCDETSLVKVDQKATQLVNGFDFNGQYLLPENTTGHYGYTCTINNTNPSSGGSIPSNIKLTKNNVPVDLDDVEFLTNGSRNAGAGSAFNRVIILTLTEIPITYTLSFNGNNGTVTNNEASLEFGTDAKLSEKPTREGYKFLGWNTKADGTGTSISKDATASELTALTDITFNTRIRAVTSTTNPITLYAQWEKIADSTPAAPATPNTGVESTTPSETTETKKNEVADTADNNMIAVPVAFTFASACAIVVVNKKRHSM